MHEYVRRLDMAVANGFLSPTAANRSTATHALECDIRISKECNCKPRYMCVLKKKMLTSIMWFKIEDDGSVMEL